MSGGKKLPDQNHFDILERALRHRRFGTLSTLTPQGRPHATAVTYAVSPRNEPIFFYVTTRTTTRKVRNIRACPDVAFVFRDFRLGQLSSRARRR